IQGYVDLVLEDEEIDPGNRRFLETAQRNADRLRRLVDDLLTLSRVDGTRLAVNLLPLDLAALTASEVATSRVLAEAKGVTLHLELPPAGTTGVCADEVRFGQVVDNLVANAIKFTRPGGEVRVSVRSVEGDVELTVSDTGIGIPVAEQARLFERF